MTACPTCGFPQRYGRAKTATVRRDFNRLRAAIRKWDAEETEKAFDKCERWLDLWPIQQPTALRAPEGGE